MHVDEIKTPFGLVHELTRAELECLVVDLAGINCGYADDNEQVCLAITMALTSTREGYKLSGRQLSKVPA